MPALNDATAVYVGGTPAQAVYLGDTKVWPSGPPPDALLYDTFDRPDRVLDNPPVGSPPAMWTTQAQDLTQFVRVASNRLSITGTGDVKVVWDLAATAYTATFTLHQHTNDSEVVVRADPATRNFLVVVIDNSHPSYPPFTVAHVVNDGGFDVLGRGTGAAAAGRYTVTVTPTTVAVTGPAGSVTLTTDVYATNTAFGFRNNVFTPLIVDDVLAVP